MWFNIGAHNLGVTAGGIAFYLMLSVAPGLAALVALYALVSDPAEVQGLMEGLVGVLPDQSEDNHARAADPPRDDAQGDRRLGRGPGRGGGAVGSGPRHPRA